MTEEERKRGYLSPKAFKKKFTDLGLLLSSVNVTIWALLPRNRFDNDIPQIGEYSGELDVVFMNGHYELVGDLRGLQVAVRP